MLFLKEIKKREERAGRKASEGKEGREKRQRGSKKDSLRDERDKKEEGKKYGFAVYSKGKFASSVKGEDDSLYEKPSEEQLRKIRELYN